MKLNAMSYFSGILRAGVRLVMGAALVLAASMAAQAQVYLYGDTNAKEATTLRYIKIERGGPNRALLTFVTGAGKQKITINHIGPDAAFTKADSCIVVMQGPNKFAPKPYIIDGDVLILGMLGFEDMHFAYPFRIRRGRFVQINPNENMYWQVQSHWHFSHVFYDAKRKILVDFNRKSWIDNKNVTAGIYALTNMIRYRGQMLLQDSKKLNLHFDDRDAAAFYREFYPYYQARVDRPLKNPVLEKKTTQLDKRKDDINLDNLPYHLR